MTLKYSFPTEKKAKELIMTLAKKDEDGNLPNFRDVKTTDFTKAIVVLGFENKRVYDDDAETYEIFEGDSFDVDVIWKDAVNSDWDKYEVDVDTPRHRFL
tara:strand:+ start:1912 stop:2211 length:300 start_codon:yes stop_codon:yes gene_type:complete